MSVNFVPNVIWSNNDLLLPADLFGVTVPTGLSSFHVRSPNYVDVTGMSRVLRSGTVAVGGAGGQLGTVNGLVTREIQVRFSDITRQWRCTPLGGPSSGQGPGRFQFQGGDVYLDLSLGIYILNTNQPSSQDQLSVDIFAAVYSHELLHVLDEIDILRNWLPSKLLVEPIIANYLVQAKPYVYGNQSQPIALVEQEFRTFIQNRMTNDAHNAWAAETTRRKDIRDAPSQYKIVQDQVDALRIRQINR